MAEQNTPGDKKLSVPSKTLTLKPRVETGTVRQSFPHGRSKQVVVEKRGKRRVGGDGPVGETVHAPEPPPVAAPPKAVAAPAPSRPATSQPQAGRGGSGVVLRTLTEDERSARANALADARVRDVEERRQAEEEAKRRASREGIEQAEREAAEARRRAEEERHRLDEEARHKAEQEAKKRFGEGEARPASATTTTATSAPAARTTATARTPGGAASPAAARTAAAAPAARAPVAAEAEGPRQIRRGPGGAVRPVPVKPTQKPAAQKQRGRLTVVTALTADDVR